MRSVLKKIAGALREVRGYSENIIQSDSNYPACQSGIPYELSTDGIDQIRKREDRLSALVGILFKFLVTLVTGFSVYPGTGIL